MSRYLLTFALACGLVAGAGYLNTGAKAEDKKDKEPVAKAEETTEGSKAAKALMSANTMAKIGRETKSPLLLLAAARVYGTTKFQKFDIAEAKQESKGGEFDVLTHTGDLIKEARDLSAGDASVEALAKQVEAEIKKFPRGAIGGAKTWKGYVEKGFDTTDDYYCTFKGGEPAFIGLQNHTNRGNINLFIYNTKTGGLITKDISKNDDASCSFSPNATVSVRIRVRAQSGDTPMRYTLTTN